MLYNVKGLSAAVYVYIKVCLYVYCQIYICVRVCVSAGNRGISLTCVLTPCRVIGVCVMLMTLGAIGAAVWAVGQTSGFHSDTHYWPTCGDHNLVVFYFKVFL